MRQNRIKRIKKAWTITFSILFVPLAIFLLLLWLVGGEEWMRTIYLWMARYENYMRGIDGITGASRVKVMGDAARHYRVFSNICRLISICAFSLFYLAETRKIAHGDRSPV